MKKSVDLKNAPRYCGISTFMNQPHSKDVTTADVAIIGIPFEMGTARATSSRPKNSPRFLAAALFSLLHGVDVLERLNIVDYGDMTVFTGQVETSFPLIEEELASIVRKGVIPISMGGCHSITYPQLKAMRQFYPDIALVQIDAHTDTHDVYFGNQRYTSGSFVRRAIRTG